jgi:uncharacterized protein with FMN-binding domain
MTEEPKKRLIAPPPARRSTPVLAAPNASRAKSGGAKNKKIANSLVALGSAAIISVYGLGYARTQAVEALYNVDAPAIAIATAAPTATDAASSPVAAYQSPLYPSTVAATATTAPPTATVVAPATIAPATSTSAPATIAKTATPATATAAVYKDGAYTGTGTGPHGSIAASVVVQGGKIVSAEITQCGTRYPCAKIAALPGQVVARQSATVDLVSGATDSSRAYQGAIQNALAKAKVAA